MAVVACAGHRTTRLEHRPWPRPGGGELLLRLRVSGLCGTDLFKLAHDAAPPGSVLGHEIVGAVAAVGAGVRGFAVGDRVVVPHHVPCGECALCRRGSETMCRVFRESLLVPGGFSEGILVRERAVRLAARKVPDGVSDEAAVFLEPAACVLRGIDRAELPVPEALRGERPACAVVVGAGSMGLLHLLTLRAARPDVQVLVTDTVQERLALARRLGAAEAAWPGAPGIERLAQEATGGLGADAVFDTVGGARALDSSLRLTRAGGCVVLFAHAAEGEHAGFDLNDLFKHERRVLGTYSGSLREQARIHELIAAGQLDGSPLVTHRLPLSRFEEGVALARARKALKVLFRPEAHS
jgi:L-iditol 2-dehydrogenase